MYANLLSAGLTPRFPSPPPRSLEPEDAFTAEAGIRPPSGQSPRVSLLVEEDEAVAQGAPVACLREAPDVCFVAPMAGRVARITLLPGSKLSEIVIFGEKGEEVRRHDTAAAGDARGLRKLFQLAGIWPWFRRRPFGGMPAPDERPSAIVVMAVDTRPFAPDPLIALAGRETDLARGLGALSAMAEGPVFLCVDKEAPALDTGTGTRVTACAPRHPHGCAGIRAHDLAPAGIEAPVWDIHAEDVAALGALLATGVVPMSRLVGVAGAALREGRLVRTQPGADLRELTRRSAAPGAHVLLSGSPLDGHEAHWLGPRDRQVTVLPGRAPTTTRHWLADALVHSARPRPVIPTAALAQAFGGGLPAVPFVRALSSGDDETAMKLGLLSLLEEDVALADYVLGGEARLAELLRAMLDRIRTEFAA